MFWLPHNSLLHSAPSQEFCLAITTLSQLQKHLCSPPAKHLLVELFPNPAASP